MKDAPGVLTKPWFLLVMPRLQPVKSRVSKPPLLNMMVAQMGATVMVRGHGYVSSVGTSVRVSSLSLP